MLSGRISFGAALSALALSIQSGAAQAQYYDGCGSCGAVAAAPISCCTPIQPMQATCYQTIPVTTYAREKQTVEVPHYETAYEEREVTVYRPVTTSREVEVPTTTYQNVVEYRTVNKDMGRWVTNYHPVAKCATKVSFRLGREFDSRAMNPKTAGWSCGQIRAAAHGKGWPWSA